MAVVSQVIFFLTGIISISCIFKLVLIFIGGMMNPETAGDIKNKVKIIIAVLIISICTGAFMFTDIVKYYFD